MLFVGGAFASLLLMGQVQSPDADKPIVADASFGEVTAHKLRVVDEKGKTRIELGMDAGMPTMRFHDDRGVARIRAVCSPEWPTFDLIDENGRARLSLGTSPKGPGIMMQSAESHPRAVLGATDDGPGLVLFDGERPRVLVGVKNNQPVMAILNDDSKLTFELPQPIREAEKPIAP